VPGSGRGWARRPIPGFGAEMLDEALGLLAQLWQGEPVTHRGRHYTIVPEVDQPFFQGLAGFTPTPLQTPRIPIWVGGNWPLKGPFRRAARWDGVFPNRLGGAVRPGDLREIVSFIANLREGRGPFEVAVGGSTSGSGQAAEEVVAPFREAGATWWMERISPLAFGWDGSGQWPLERMRERILAGPPGSGE
jgi:alkanesulfonate monooxygenase SsuD/methylene tetrahydromethanopterin reductase-like flavin-dependent oxidoreductase (luciferase family)